MSLVLKKASTEDVNMQDTTTNQITIKSTNYENFTRTSRK